MKPPDKQHPYSAHVPASTCPCPQAVVLDGATGASPNKADRPTPKPGDVTFCFYCSRLLRFEQDGKLTEADEDAVLADMESAGPSDRAQVFRLMRNFVRQRCGYPHGKRPPPLPPAESKS